MRVELNTNQKTETQFAVSYQQNGYGAVIPVINGEEHPELMMGFVSDADRDAGLKLLEEALNATGGDIYAAKMYMYTAATTAANDIKAEEAVDEILISYTERKAYVGTREVANLDDLHCELPREAIKALLVERARNCIDEECDFDFDEE